MKRFIIIFVLFSLIFSAVAYISGTLEPFEAAPIILGGAAFIALVWAVGAPLLDKVLRQEDEK